MADELVELLLRTERVNDPMTLKPRLINPDGPEAATTITRLTDTIAAQAREIEAWAALAHKAFHAADVVLAPICADVGKEILHPENCPDLVSVMFADGVQIPAQHYADLYWATHPDLIHALTGGQP